MKKILAFLITATLIMTMLVPAFAEDMGYGDEPVACDPLNNDLFDIVAEIKAAETGEGEIFAEQLEEEWGEEITDENGEVSANYDYIHRIIYMDGSSVAKKVISLPSVMRLELIDRKFIDVSEEKNFNEYVLLEDDYESSTSDIYKVVIENGEIVSKELKYILETKEDYSYNIYKATEKNGEITKELYTTVTEEEYYNYIFDFEGTDAFNDGLKYNEDGHLVDINDEIHYFEGQLSYHGIDYNIGYLNENFNNGGVLDWSLPDPEKYRTFDTTMYNMFGDDSYYFENTKIEPIDDYGYSIMTINIDGNKSEYIVKIKKPAIVTVFLDGEKIKFDQIPVIEDGRTLVPLRAIFDALGAEVEWNGDTSTVTATKDDVVITLTVENTIATKNGEEITLDVPAKIINGRTVVPARFVADCFGVNVEWNADMKQVILASQFTE